MSGADVKGRDMFLRLLLDEGVTHLFGNPGTTELALMEAVPNYPSLKYVLGLQESVVLGMADGFARATGQLVACNLHCTPGLGHAMGALYNAKFSGSPIIVTAGQYEIGYGLTEPLLYEPLVPIAEPLVKWAVEVQRADDLPRIVRRAAKVALTPPMGPVFISLPGSVLDETVTAGFGSPSRISRDVRPGEGLLKQLSSRILQSQRPVIIAGKELADRDAFAEASALAEMIGAPVYAEPVPYNTRFPAEHPNHMGDLSRNQPLVREILSHYDLLICLGADLLRMSPYSPVEPLPTGMPAIHLTERSWELGKNFATEIAVCADVKATLCVLNEELERTAPVSYRAEASIRNAALAEKNWGAKRAKKVASIRVLASETVVHQDYLMWRISELIPTEAIVVEEALTSAPALAATLRVADPRSYYGLASGGLGFGVPGAVGVSLAHPKRRVVAILGDGSSMYSIQALWTAANQRLPITFIIVNNQSYRIIKERLLALRGTDRFVAMDMKDPPIDFVQVGRGLGLDAHSVSETKDLDEALSTALSSEGPTLLEVKVQDGF